MKKIKVIVKDKFILELTEDASKGDLIDLRDVVEVDTSFLDLIIENGKDKVYSSKLEEAKKAINAENQIEINKLLSNIEFLKKEKEDALKLKEQEVTRKLFDQISDLKRELEVLKSTKQTELDVICVKHKAETIKIKQEDDAKFVELEQKYNIIMSQYESQIKQAKLQMQNEFDKKINEISTNFSHNIANKDLELEKYKASLEKDKHIALEVQKNKFEEEIRLKEDIINNLQRAKSSMNVKQTGEDLESWCDNEVISYMQNGLLNCTWEKDNKVVKDDDELKGSKADYIFNIYANDKHISQELLASVCLDMKDENPDSINKKANSDYYKQLDKNREKKNCRYAVLVSNLEMDKPNILPIFKVREFENMYVVRPAYLMVFLNMITSLTTRFAELILIKENEVIELKGKIDLMTEFEEIKKTYLDKPLELLEKSLDSIMSSSESIKKACRNIDDQCEKINKSYISQICEKINKYELKLTKNIVRELI